MEPRYYTLKSKSKPNAQGIVLRLSDELLEVIAGESYLTEIGEKEAKRMQEEYENWKLMQGWVSSDTTPTNVLSNTPGTQEWAHRRG